MKNQVYKAKVPSNIAFLKYWGKEDPSAQWPTNNSLSMTLKNCCTETSVFMNKSLKDFSLLVGGKPSQGTAFSKKVFQHLSFLKEKYDFSFFLEVETENNFPTASGVASSASGFAALTLASLAAWTNSKTLGELKEKGFSLEEMAYLARLGSGSSCRSFFEGYVLWEKGEKASEQKVRSLHSEAHWNLSDVVVVLSQEEKQLSSREAHSRVKSSPFFQVRLAGLAEKQKSFEEALSEKNISALGALLEEEALDIHSVLMTAKKPFSYLTDATLSFLVWLRKQREKENIKAYFTIDAGSNVHVICETSEKAKLLELLKRDYSNLNLIEDSVGFGPELTSFER